MFFGYYPIIKAVFEKHFKFAISWILKIVVYDLRSPIAGIMSLVRLIKHDAELSKTELNELIDLVEKSSDNALVFIEDLLLLNNKP